LGLSCSEKYWDAKSNLPKKSHPDKAVIDSIIAKKLKEYKEKVLNFKQEDKDFTPDVLISATNKPLKKTTVFNYFILRIQHFKDRNQVGNAKVYSDTFNQLKAFVGNKDFSFSQLDYSFLVKFETHMKSKDLSDNGISVRFRTIRALFNSAIEESFVKRDIYPFNRFKISERYSTKTKKRAITKEDIKKIESLVLKKNTSAFEAQQLFLFSYYGQGINFVDIAHLKWSNLINGRIFYRRAKTGNELNFKLAEPALGIIEHFKITKTPVQGDYIFPILNKEIHITPTQKHNRIHKVLTRVNKELKNIGKALAIEVSLTSYVARHTFATVLKSSGVNTAVISEAMGHQTEAITQTYLKSFENSIIDEAMEHLL
jgi:integrase